MQIKINSQKFGNNIKVLMRKIGYLPLRDPRTGQTGYVRRLRRGFYPRFHAHISLGQNKNVLLDLHYDTAKPMHIPGTTRVEKDGEVLEEEVRRIMAILG